MAPTWVIPYQWNQATTVLKTTVLGFGVKISGPHMIAGILNIFTAYLNVFNLFILVPLQSLISSIFYIFFSFFTWLLA